MSENVSFIQGSKENYNPSEMAGGVFFSKDSKEILLNGESYGNATPADEEDITAESGNLKLKDRAYDEANFSGLGYKILRKNVSGNKNILTQDMMNAANTVYEIRYDFDLNGATITVPENCILKFNGGSLSNGTIEGQNTLVHGDRYKLFSDVILNGVWDKNESFPEWLGAVGNGINDDSSAIQLCLNAFKIVNVGIREYKVLSEISMPKNSSIIGKKGSILSCGSKINMGWGTELRNLYIKKETPATAISITSENVGTTFLSDNEFRDTPGNSSILIENCMIYCSNSEETLNQNAIELLANGLGVGFYGVTIRGVSVIGKYNYAVILDTERTKGSVSTWLTDITLQNIFINGAINGFYLHKGDIDLGPERVRILNCSQQYKDYSVNFINAQGGNRIVIDNCEPWDWPNGVTKYKINRDKIQGIVIRNTINDYRKIIEFDGDATGEYSNVVTNDLSFSTPSGELSNYITLRSGEKIKKQEIYNLLPGIYRVESSYQWGAFLNFPSPFYGASGGYLSVERIVGGRVLLRYFADPITKNTLSKNGVTMLFNAFRYTELEEDLDNWVAVQPHLKSFDSKSEYLTSGAIPYALVVINGKLGYNPSASSVLDAMGNPIDAAESGISDDRPTGVKRGYQYFDATLYKPIWWAGTKWVDADGNNPDGKQSDWALIE